MNDVPVNLVGYVVVPAIVFGLAYFPIVTYLARGLASRYAKVDLRRRFLAAAVDLSLIVTGVVFWAATGATLFLAGAALYLAARDAIAGRSVGKFLFGLAVIYRYGPSRREARWQWLSVGSVSAAILWLAGSALLSWYLANVADYDATYGSLGAAIGLMMWLWLSAIVILLGAELNSEIEHQTARDSTVGTEKPLGRRGAVMADTVGKSTT